MTPAKRGDLIVVREILGATFGYNAPEGALRARSVWHVGRVTRVDREGWAVEFEYYPIVGGLRRQTLRGREGEKFGKSLDGWGTFVQSAEKVDVDAMLEAAAAHTYAGHPTQVQPFDDIAEIIALAKERRR